MPRTLPYKVTTATGNQLEFEFPLHPQTVSPVQVSQLLTAVLAALDREIKLLGQVGNGDLLQALAMALAARSRMLGGGEPVEKLSRELLDAALSASVQEGEGNLRPDEPKAVH